MSTNTSSSIPSAGSGRRVLHTDDPSEFLAETRISLKQAPTDCLILLGHGGHGGHGGHEVVPVVTTSSLSDLFADDRMTHLQTLLGMLLDKGMTRGAAMLVLGDGYEEIAPDLVEDITILSASRLLLTASSLLPDPFPLDAVWVVGNSEGRRVLLGSPDGDGERILVSPPRPLRDFAETRAAAGEVYTGRLVPLQGDRRAAVGRLEAVPRSLRLERTGLAARCDPGTLFAEARGALGRLQASSRGPEAPGFVTDCERVASLLSAVAVDRLHWELLAQCVDLGNAATINREELLQLLVRDGSWRPHEDVCAGGSWYEALSTLREIARGAMTELPIAQRGIAREAWRGLTAMLVILSWWNHRFSTGGCFVDELWEREPESSLAPLLARMTDTPIFPAWWPST
ncbi:hypothetical protein [Brachybacterium alimentarium]|uniref:hypothetical protein n=1 Tax=Brachybacterium alimentarium TaxID=47845 RepID=UPI000DF1BF95|nr:hypothetical protein [Brachybacterium alimentarium]RCS69843.1 hypothetical protein CIK68_11220 [Brachybacterium alimentarium]RCS78603.1 hypothetical protein CIK70_09965 [Brachybacterium alimentarium]RCS83855.1 hypothetical protein CIK67_11820 [Brachybacterium alimentarium]